MQEVQYSVFVPLIKYIGTSTVRQSEKALKLRRVMNREIRLLKGQQPHYVSPHAVHKCSFASNKNVTSLLSLLELLRPDTAGEQGAKKQHIHMKPFLSISGIMVRKKCKYKNNTFHVFKLQRLPIISTT